MKEKMMNQLLFWLIMIMGTTLTFSSNKWLMMWTGLEMNMMGFIPMLHKTKNFYSSESMIIYFSIQSMGSMIMLMSIMTSKTFVIINNTIIMGIMIKLSSAPFHFWLPELLNKLSWSESLILLTWQKIAPMMILIQLNINSNLFIFTFLSVTISMMKGIGQTSLHKIIGYSSINHLGWMIASINYSKTVWLTYLAIYTINLMPILYLLDYSSIKYINQSNMMNMTYMQKLNFTMLMINLGGMPPTMGFYPKWLIIMEMMKNTEFLIMYMILTSLMILFMYLRLIMPIMLLNNLTLNHQKKSNNTIMIMMVMFILPLYLMY